MLVIDSILVADDFTKVDENDGKKLEDGLGIQM